MTLLERPPTTRVGGRYLVDMGAAAARQGIPFPVLLTYAAYGDAVRWDRTDLDESEDVRLAAVLAAVAELRAHLFQHPHHRHVVSVRRLLNMLPSGAHARGVLPTPTHLSVELGASEDGAPVIIVGLIS